MNTKISLINLDKLEKVPIGDWEYAHIPHKKSNLFEGWFERHIYSTSEKGTKFTVEEKTTHESLSYEDVVYSNIPEIMTSYIARAIENGKIRQVLEGYDEPRVKELYDKLSKAEDIERVK